MTIVTIATAIIRNVQTEPEKLKRKPQKPSLATMQTTTMFRRSPSQSLASGLADGVHFQNQTLTDYKHSRLPFVYSICWVTRFLIDSLSMVLNFSQKSHLPITSLALYLGLQSFSRGLVHISQIVNFVWQLPCACRRYRS